MEAPTYDLSVIVPTCDMSAHLPALVASLVAGSVVASSREVLFVDDGSRDDTPATLRDLCAARPDRLRTITLPENQGRYRARLAGARAAAGTHLLFLDTRVNTPAGFAAAMAETYRHGAGMAAIRIDDAKSLYNLYWERTHARLFARNRRDERAGFAITPENYDRYVTGMGGLLCRRDEFLRACETFGDRALLSDDTFLLRELVKGRPLLVREGWFVWWEPRQTLASFLYRLWDRGPGFVEYHVVARRGVYFYVLLACATYLAAGVVATARGWTAGPWLLTSIPLGLLASTSIFARGAREFARLAPLHLAVCLTAAAGVVHGLFAAIKGAR